MSSSPRNCLTPENEGVAFLRNVDVSKEHDVFIFKELLDPRRQRHRIPPKRREPRTQHNDVTSQKTCIRKPAFVLEVLMQNLPCLTRSASVVSDTRSSCWGDDSLTHAMRFREAWCWPPAVLLDVAIVRPRQCCKTKRTHPSAQTDPHSTNSMAHTLLDQSDSAFSDTRRLATLLLRLRQWVLFSDP